MALLKLVIRLLWHPKMSPGLGEGGEEVWSCRGVGGGVEVSSYSVSVTLSLVSCLSLPHTDAARCCSFQKFDLANAKKIFFLFRIHHTLGCFENLFSWTFNHCPRLDRPLVTHASHCSLEQQGYMETFGFHMVVGLLCAASVLQGFFLHQKKWKVEEHICVILFHQQNFGATAFKFVIEVSQNFCGNFFFNSIQFSLFV